MLINLGKFHSNDRSAMSLHIFFQSTFVIYLTDAILHMPFIPILQD
jgi:hypothetical protein